MMAITESGSMGGRMGVVQEIVIRPNTGEALTLERGRKLRVYGTTIADFVAFDRHDRRERFDQARTKTYNATIYITAGHMLMTKSNEPILLVTEDTYKEGTHDMQKGMCSAARVQRAVAEGRLRDYYNREISPDELPDHGCYENLSRALEPYGIPPEDIPSPFNLFQTIRLELPSGKMFNTSIRPRPGTYIEFEAQRDALIGISACPDLTVGGKEIRAVILDA
jgi:uncharacterized protein YcgI (DUF1989 family)